MSAQITADRSGPGAEYWEALDNGKLIFQRCRTCDAAQLPPRHECTSCLSSDLDWENASGRARLISWVVYHRAYHDSMAAEIPYIVAIVELDEGPRLISNIRCDAAVLEIEMPLVFSTAERFSQRISLFSSGS